MATKKATVKYNPKTGAKLKKGESVSYNGKTYTQGSTAIGGTTSSSGGGGSSSSSNKGDPGVRALQEQLNARGANLTVDGIMGPKTEAAIATYNKTGGNGGTPASTPTPTPIPEKKELPVFTTQTLNLGSKGDEVKELQSYLSGIGYKDSEGKPLKADGIYGPETQKAVMQFQQKNNLKTDGVAGPLTKAVILKSQTTDKEIISPETDLEKIPFGIEKKDWDTFTPIERATLKANEEIIKSQVKEGYKVNPNISIDEETAARFLKFAREKVHPVFQEQIDNVLAQTERDIQANLSAREREMTQGEQAFQENLGGAREGFAESGLTFSGQRAAKEQAMAEQENKERSYRDLLYGEKVSDLARTAEQKVGSERFTGFKLPTLATKRASLGGYSGKYTPGENISLGYQPGKFKYGELTDAENRAIEARNLALQEQANKLLTQGRSYEDLLK